MYICFNTTNRQLMRQTILTTLAEVERDHKIKILFSCESGSRAWGFPSPDSDYDVRFIYSRPYAYYLSILDHRHDLRFPISGELDIYGWDIRKVLKLVLKSNTTPFEWLQSPIIYRENKTFQDALWQLCQHYFSQRSNIHHYLGIARGALDTMENESEIKIKKLFYVLRPLLAAKWCQQKNSIAPMTIDPLITLLPPALQKQVEDLIKYKATAAEAEVIRVDPALQSYINNEISEINVAAAELPRDNFEPRMLDEFFVKTISV
jgi:uncharacterized protein